MPRWGGRLLASLLAVLSVAAVILLYYQQNPFLEAFEAKSYDLRFKKWRGPLAANDAIAIIAIDDKSIAELGRFPWSRRHYVTLLDRLSSAGAKGVLFDAFYPEQEKPSVDRAFADALRRSGNVILAASYKLDAELQVIDATHSLDMFESSAAAIAHINLLPEEDGINRRNLLVIDERGSVIPSLGLAGAMVALGERELAPAEFGILLGAREIPTDSDYAMWINFTGPAGSYPHYSFTDVVHGRIPAEKLKGKVLFVGATALGIYDMRVTPFDGNTPGVEVHATVADNIISNHFVRQSGIEALFDIGAILVVGLAVYILAIRFRLYAAVPVAIVLAMGYLLLSYQMFLAGHWVSIVYPVTAAIVSLLTGGSYRYLVLERSAREMRSIFSSYVSPKVVARLEREPDTAKIGGDSKEITVVFTDIKGFTSFSEKHTPQEVVSRLNEYLDAMVEVIDRFDGTVDKFIGDGIMVYWGAPLAQPDHARHAIECLLAMKQKMDQLYVRWQLAGIEPFKLRGGIQSGEVVAGNIGSRGKKMEYTVIGDTVNLAARLEGSAKYYGVEFLVGESTYQRTCDLYRYREIDKMRMVGKKIPVVVYELIGPLTLPPSPMVEKFAQALTLYRQRRWEDAYLAFSDLVKNYPADQPSRIYSDRCNYFLSHPPGAEWDGVFNRLDK